MDSEKEEELQKEFNAEDELIRRYADKLKKVYSTSTAGDHTFEGILSSFLTEYVKAQHGHGQSIGNMRQQALKDLEEK